MSWIHALIAPPGHSLVLAVAGLFLWRPRKRLACALVVVAVASLLLHSLPIVGATLLRSLQTEPVLARDDELPAADAIVVLGAGVAREAAEFGGMTVDRVGLERLRYAAALQRRTGLPLLVTGGPPREGEPPIASIMARVLTEDFNVPVRWLEERAENTAENARLAAEILGRAELSRALVVTHAWHMPRARQAFARTSVTFLPAPTGFRAPQPMTVGAFLPTARALHESSWAWHEWVGRIYYALGGG